MLPPAILTMKVVGIVVMLNVRTLNQEFCTRAFTFYVLTKDEIKNFGTAQLCVPVGPMMLAAAITHLKIMSVIFAANQTR